MAEDPQTPTLPPTQLAPSLPERPVAAQAVTAAAARRAGQEAPTFGGPTAIHPSAFAPSRRRPPARWPFLAALALSVAAAVFLVFFTEEEPPTAASQRNIDASATDAVAEVGDTRLTGAFEVTLVQAVDPWIPSNDIERAAEGRRLVAVELSFRNTGSTLDVVTAQTMATLTHDGDRTANFGVSLLDLTPIDGQVEPGGTRNGWVVFELPADAADLVLEIRGSLLTAPVRFTL